MADTQTNLRARLIGAVRRVPAGRVLGIGTLARHVAVPVPLALAMVRAIAASRDSATPWQRVVADGGAIGRHEHREAQIALLRAEGVQISPAGVVQDFTNRAVGDMDRASLPEPGAAAPPRLSPDAAPSRARGRFAQPSSTVGRK